MVCDGDTAHSLGKLFSFAFGRDQLIKSHHTTSTKINAPVDLQDLER